MAESVVQVRLGRRSYPIYVGSDVLSSLGKKVKKVAEGEKCVVVTNPRIAELYGERVTKSLEEVSLKVYLLEVDEGEEHKSLEEVTKFYQRLVKRGIGRFDAIVALGGGVIGDLAGFVAATYMRGIPLIQAPTTLLAQVDSSIGGKVGVNLPQGKNLVGCFYQPKFVLADVSVLKTLPKKELKVGLAEVIKYGFIVSDEFLSYVEAHLEAILKAEEDVLTQIVLGCCKTKARVVEEDERDFGRRAILNYGHTVGHAIEALTGYKMLHGEAISIGMVCAAYVACEMGFIDKSLLARHINLLAEASLPTELPKLGVDEIVKQIGLDKKAKGESSIFVLLKGIGLPVVVDVSDDVLDKALTKAKLLAKKE